MGSKKKTIKVGTISGKDAFLKRRNKNVNDEIAKMGVGFHTPEEHKEKNRQRQKNELREICK